MKRFIDIMISFAPHIIFPLIYIIFAGGKKGFIKKIDSLSANTKGKKVLYSITVSVVSVLYWLAAVYVFMNIVLTILNLIPGIAI